MKNISLSEGLHLLLPDLRLLCIECDVEPGASPAALLSLIEGKSAELRSHLKMDAISSLPVIKASRRAYRLTGKDPARYRLSAEALLRRIVRGEELYRINNVVDLLNLVSVTSGFSIGGYDADSIEGDVEFDIGSAGEPYAAIGRGELNIEGLPVFRDRRGAFGTPTSDSERTAVTSQTRRFLMVIIDFEGDDSLEAAGNHAVKLLSEFAGAQKIEKLLID